MTISGLRSLVSAAALFGLTTAAWATGGSASYVYDGAGRLLAVLYESGKGQIYTYDPAGNRGTSFSGTPAVLALTATATANEGGSVTLTVTRTNSAAVATSVKYQTVDGTAIAGTNYTAASGTLTFAATDTSKTFTIATLNDGKYDGPLNFYVRLTPVNPNAAISTDSAIVSIADASSAPVFAVAGVAGNEGNTLNFTVTRTGATSLTQSINYVTSDAAATSGLDYVAQSGSLSFAPSDTSHSFTVPTIRRLNYEGTRAFRATLSNPTNGAVLGTSAVNGTITDVDNALSFAISGPATVNEGATPTYTVTASGGPAGIPFSINYATADGTAVAGTDYTAASGTLSFPVGTTTQTINVPTAYAHTDTNIRNFTVTLTNPTNYAPINTASVTTGIQSWVGAPAAPVLSPTSRYTTLSSLAMTWTAPAGNATSYKLWMTNTSNTTPVLVYNGTALSYTYSNASSDTYQFQVQGCNASGCGTLSNTSLFSVCLGGNC